MRDVTALSPCGFHDVTQIPHVLAVNWVVKKDKQLNEISAAETQGHVSSQEQQLNTILRVNC